MPDAAWTVEQLFRRVSQVADIRRRAALIVDHRNFPALLDLADNVCQSLFGAESFNATVQAAYSNQGHPLRYVSERQTKR